MTEENLKRLIRLLRSAREVLGSEDKAVAWVVRDNRALGCPPFDLLDSDRGLDLATSVLDRVEHGVVG